MYDSFPEKSVSMGENRTCHSLKARDLSSLSFPKKLLGRVDPSRMGEGEKGQTKSYGSQGALQVLTVGFRTASAAKPFFV